MYKKNKKTEVPSINFKMTNRPYKNIQLPLNLFVLLK
jgi:hypothetical protein